MRSGVGGAAIGAGIAMAVTAVAMLWLRPGLPASPEIPPSSGLRIAEIRILPGENGPAFVELLNAGSEQVALTSVTLRPEGGQPFPLPNSLSMPPGGRLVVVFDGLTGTEQDLIHAPTSFTGGESGSVQLEVDGRIADAVAWGKPDMRSVDLCRGGRCAAPGAGTIVARLPDDERAFVAAAWAPLDSALATPGRPNPRPPVSAFAGLPGAIFTGRPRFSWYGVPGAARYRVQVASTDTFASPVHDAEVAATAGVRLEQVSVNGPELASGQYFWRVQPIASGGAAGEFSQARPFEVDRSRAQSPVRRQAAQSTPGSSQASAVGTSGASSRAQGGEPDAPVELLKVLDVPVLDHAKDTRMLTLEAKSERPPWSWDTPEVGGYPYCARAGVAMVNAFYGGKLSQDRIGYEAFKDLRDGPEYDLPVVGVSDDRISRHMLPLALGTRGEYRTNPGRNRDGCMDAIRELVLEQCAAQCADRESPECRRCRYARETEVECPYEVEFGWGIEAMADIRREIDAGRPIIASDPSHVFLIVGYRLQGDRFSFLYQDAGGRVEHVASASGLLQNLDSYWTGLTPVKVGSDAPEVSTDSDGDGLVDFDEAQRFGTDPAQADSDGDGIRDKDEIRASVWDPEQGYHRAVAALASTESEPVVVQQASAANLSGRDFDRDGLAMELDPDSDGGGCDDGDEDENADGRRDRGETSNFDPRDDNCGPPPLGGRVKLSYDYAGGNGVCVGRLDIEARFELVPDPNAASPDKALVYVAPAMTYRIRTDGCRDLPGDALHYEFNQGFQATGTQPLTPESLGQVQFWPTWPKFVMQLPQNVTFPGRPPNRLVGTYSVPGNVYPAETFARFEALDLESDPAYCATQNSSSSRRPWFLEFCVEATRCAGSAAPIDCLTDPQRSYVLPFRRSINWSSPAGEPGGSHFIGNVSGVVEVCAGCGRRFD